VPHEESVTVDASRQQRRGRRAGTLLAIVAISAALVAVPVHSVQANPPPTNPSDTQLKKAAARKAALATRVGQLSGQIADLQGRIQQLDAAAELAEQKLAYALQQLEQARAAAAAARARVQAAQDAVDTASRKFTAFVRASYIGSPLTGAAGSLLTASDPNALLQRGDYVRYSAAHDLDVIGAMNKATVAKSNADAAARAAVQRQTAAADAATQAKQAADQALRAAQAQRRQLSAQLSANQAALDAARTELATLNHQRAAYIAWKKEQARIAAARAAAAARARQAALEAARARAAQSGAGQNFAPPPSAPSSGGWTAGEGQTAVNRAMQFLGIAYAFAAGNFSGPTNGVCVSGDAFNDCHVYGFDCSGLALYGWAPYLHLDHYAATQYGQAGSYHPSESNLMPGDLVFWSSDGTQAGIHHVAIYIGGGNVIQAPQSGDIVRVTPLGEVDAGYFGATRPLS
jgi:cell wall-associated NlpC family hydrolase